MYLRVAALDHMPWVMVLQQGSEVAEVRIGVDWVIVA